MGLVCLQIILSSIKYRATIELMLVVNVFVILVTMMTWYIGVASHVQI
jgi:hypothetical protein